MSNTTHADPTITGTHTQTHLFLICHFRHQSFTCAILSFCIFKCVGDTVAQWLAQVPESTKVGPSIPSLKVPLRSSQSCAVCHHQTAEKARLAHAAVTQDSPSIGPTNLVVKSLQKKKFLFLFNVIFASLVCGKIMTKVSSALLRHFHM